VRDHAHTAPEAGEVTYKDEPLRILKVRNPRGSQEWNGAWSDGSKEWTAQVMKELNDTFGDDGERGISPANAVTDDASQVYSGYPTKTS